MKPGLKARAALVAVTAVFAGVLSGCATGPVPTTENSSVRVAATPVATAAAERAGKRRHKARSPRPAPQSPAIVACDENITVRAATTSCPFAQNVFFAFYENASAVESQNAIEAYSPVSRQNYAVACATDAGENVTCVAGDGGEVHFGLGAVAVYDDEQAAAYASSHDLGPQRAADNEAQDGSGADSRGETYGGADLYEKDESHSDEPYDASDAYGDEIPNYDEGNGYRVQCADGMYSQSGGIQGACSGHGGLG